MSNKLTDEQINNMESSRIALPERNNVKPTIDGYGRSYGTGRRKEAVARVWLKVGNGSIEVNGVDIMTYFKNQSLYFNRIRRVFSETSTIGVYDVVATVKGGGMSGQVGALIHGISRALDRIDPNLHLILRKSGLLTRDSRVVERKKYGQPKARKKFQFAKR